MLLNDEFLKNISDNNLIEMNSEKTLKLLLELFELNNFQ